MEWTAVAVSIIRAMSAIGADHAHAIYSSEQVRGFDRYAIETLGIPGFELMQRAARAALELLRRQWPGVRRPAIFCGAGNNAGDGYLLAALAREAGLDPQLIAVHAPDALRDDAARARAAALAAGIRPQDLADAAASPPDLCVDALLGTGLARDVVGPMADAVLRINQQGCPVLALDVPTGLDSDSGRIRGCAVRADATISFVALKSGLFLGEGPALRGRLVCAGLGLPARVFAGAHPVLRRSDPDGLGQILRPRSRISHKSMNGRVLVVGGSSGMAGAARLAGEAALRAGAGLVHVAVAPDSVGAVMAGRPEIMCRGVSRPDELSDWLDAADVVVVGPGLGSGDWGDGLANRLLAADKPLVVDADALNFLARHPARRAQWVLTPHPGEAARLLASTTAEVQTARLEAVGTLARHYGGIVVLKGACSLIADDARSPADCPGVCDRGNPGMATAGMGDVLAGIIGALIGQFGLSRATVEAAVLVHALAGDDAARDGERGLIASDLFPYLRRWINPV